MRASVWVASFLLLSACALPVDSSKNQPTPAPPTSFTGTGETHVLIYSGEGSWQPEIDSLAHTLSLHSISYNEVSSAQLETLTLDELARSSLIIFPGGDSITVTRQLSKQTHIKLRTAVQTRGLNYLGFCAGAWLAVAPAPTSPEDDVSFGMGVVAGPVLDFNYLSKEGRHFAVIRASFADGTQRNQLWYGGPITPNIPGGVVAKYPDGTPAITQIRSGRGFVIVSGLHPTANPPILAALALDRPENREAIAPEYAWKLLESAMYQKPLPAF